MSIRTILEINHDCLRQLEADPKIMEKISWLVKAYHTNTFGSHDSWNWPSGIRILGTRHHSETLELTVK